MQTNQTLFDDLILEVDRGVAGLNEGLPMGFERIYDYVAGIQHSRYDLIGGDIGSGKTAFLDNCYLLNPYDYLQKNPQSKVKLKVLYFSLEISRRRKIAKLVAWKLWKDYGILVNTNMITSRGKKNRISKELYAKVMSVQGYFDQMEAETLEFRDQPLKPKGFYAAMKEYSEKHGVWHKEGNKQIYEPNDPYVYHMIVIDHIGLVSSQNKKKAIDEISQYCVWFRNKCHFSPVIVSQYNRVLQSSDRAKLSLLEPRLSDFKETAATQEDADTVIALFNPFRYKIPDYYGYDVKTLKNRIRTAHILKNRDGDEGKVVPLNFFGEIGYFREFPKEEVVSKAAIEVGLDINKSFDNYGGKSANIRPIGYGEIALDKEFTTSGDGDNIIGQSGGLAF